MFVNTPKEINDNSSIVDTHIQLILIFCKSPSFQHLYLLVVHKDHGPLLCKDEKNTGPWPKVNVRSPCSPERAAFQKVKAIVEC